MSISTPHPLYLERYPEWILIQDCYEGEGRIKKKSTAYLKPTLGMMADGMAPDQEGYQCYSKYIWRAYYANWIALSVLGMVGSMHSRPPIIELPRALKPLLSSATPSGESLSLLLRRINVQQLVTGRIGLMAELPIGAEASSLPYIATYSATSMLNWDSEAIIPSLKQETDPKGQLSMVVLQEEKLKRDGWVWKNKKQYRALLSADGKYVQEIYDEDGVLVDQIVPTFRSETYRNGIPFVIINANDLVPEPAPPPLLNLAHLSLKIYAAEADYRRHLYMQGEDTLVISGDLHDDEATKVRVGSGSVIKLPSGADAKYIGVNSRGLTEQRLALEDDRKAALDLAGRFVDDSRQKESGEALYVRSTAKAVTLTGVALSAGEGLERILKDIAVWAGANPKEVSVMPNTDFVLRPFTSKQIVDLMTAKNMGAPISQRAIHNLMIELGMTKLDFETEMNLIDEEGPGTEWTEEPDGVQKPDGTEQPDGVEEK